MTTKTKARKPATDAQRAALTKAREARAAKRRIADFAKSEPPIPASPAALGVDPDGGASWRGPLGDRMQPCSREIKMLRPICERCEKRLGGSRFLIGAWQEKCEHDPYVTLAERTVKEPVYKPVDPDDPSRGQEVLGLKTVITYEPAPNWVSITHGGGVNKGRGVDRALKRGYIFPQQLRSKVYPNGIKRRCQFRNCYSENVTKYLNGWFCREIEAQLVKVSDTSTTYEVGQFSARSDQFQRNILEAQAVRF